MCGANTTKLPQYEGEEKPITTYQVCDWKIINMKKDERENHTDFVAALCDKTFISLQRILSVQLQKVWVNFCT